MPPKQQTFFEHLRQLKKQFSTDHMEYWFQYSTMNTWQFWVCLILLIGPLVLLYFQLDRSKAFHFGFFGYSVHVFTAYADTFGVTKGLWDYPYKVIPILPVSLMVDASLVPVVYMLVYQWAVNHRKSPVLFLTLTSVCFAFILKPFLSLIGLFLLFDGMSFFLLFIAYMVVMSCALLVMYLFKYLQRSSIRRLT
ncbi:MULTISPECIES: CBO0543 family protein [Paenibacillus]|uniref:CBO0543 family protein n=1 Tax=Paenibacillus TaxID=44249 RepID=UPI0022B90BC5|nr:CBO0543 family protein [Paenibacillus caseinilyticus]MCZ8521170.1 hypothetical protein [Paenibacillus caseinilyticus]